ncbi:homeobox protein NANOG [Thalassophryne amazonica]|uniref:homeobox protein NANOG n=1 Tax=Thalassophryne amazonica TaxID=390379 RepID=UPI0014724B15|nr:homeobox protein NANOG [Thalassophryne amazonica]
MAEWKARISYNRSYHAYAYGLMYQPGAEQSSGNPSGWVDGGVADMCDYTPGKTQTYYPAANSKTHEESGPHVPDQGAVSGHRHYQSSGGLVYLGDPQSGRLVLTPPHRPAYDSRTNEARRTGSDSTSDSESHISPDSWSSSSSREGSLPQVDPATWAKNELYVEPNSTSPDASEDVSSSLMLEPQNFAVTSKEGPDDGAALDLPSSAATKPKTPAPAAHNKGKARTTFTEGQMNALVQRFSAQRYLTPAEMKNLADVTGLSYKQVKTWFQNRRMKLRRHQKDNSWVSERYTINKNNGNSGGFFPNIPPHVQAYQGKAPTQYREHYSQHTMEEPFQPTPHNLTFYVATMSSTSGSTGYPSWSSGLPQTAVPARPQANGWPMNPGVSFYDYSHNRLNSVSLPCVENNVGNVAGFNGKDGECVSGYSPLNTTQ